MKNIKEYCSDKKAELKKYLEDNGIHIKTVVVQVGDNPASNAYIKGKLKDCGEVGIACELRHFEETIAEEELISEVEALNMDSSIDGFIVQLPLPKHISEERITEAIDFHKDIDGFTKEALVNPATPQGILTYLEDNGFKFEDANAVVIGRSSIVGKPMARLLTDKNCNVTLLHSKTSLEKKRQFLDSSNLIVVATGHRYALSDADFGKHKDGQFLVDVGINKRDDGKLCGDCEDVTIVEKTPVPGGVGLLTRLALLQNIVRLYELNNKKVLTQNN